MTDYQTPETALLDLDWLLDQAGLFITPNAIDCELEARREEFYFKVSGCPAPRSRGVSSTAREFSHSAPAAVGDLRQEIRRYLSHVSVEEIYDTYLDRMAKLELACRKAEVERRLGRMLSQNSAQATRQAA